MANVFLSYSRADRLLASELVRTLRESGVDVWWDDQLLPGERWRDTISDALAHSDSALLLVTPASVASRSARTEWQQAIASTKRIVPVLAGGIDFPDLPSEVQHIQAIRLQSDSNDKSYSLQVAQLVYALKEATPRKGYRGGVDRRLDYLETPFPEIRRLLQGAKYEIDLAADSLGGLFGPLPTMFAAPSLRSVRIRVVLPDARFFGDPEGGRNLELAAKSQIAVEQFFASQNPNLSVRLVTKQIAQAMLRVDDWWLVDPLPASPASHGYVRLGRLSAAEDLFAASSAAFETLFMSGRESIRELPDQETFRSDVERLLLSPNEKDLQRAAQSYFSNLGYETVSDAHSGGSEYDLLMWRPSGGAPAIVEVKGGKRPLSASVVDQLVWAARQVGASQAYLVTGQPLTASALQRLSQAQSPELEVNVLTPEILLQALTDTAL